MATRKRDDSTLNFHSRAVTEELRLLSNFAATEFELDGRRLASIEGFWQGTKFVENDPLRTEAFESSGVEAKRFGSLAIKSGFVFWNGRVIRFASPAHKELIKRALRAKFEQNEIARTALLATGSKTLVHKPPRGSNSIVLSNDELAEFLMTLRSELAVQTADSERQAV